MKSPKKQPKSKSINTLLFRLWLLFLSLALIVLLSFPSLTKLRLQSYYSKNFSDIFTLLDFYIDNLEKSEQKEFFDLIQGVSAIVIEVGDLNDISSAEGRKFLADTIDVKNLGSQRVKIEKFSYSKNRKVSILLETPTKQYTMALMYLLVNLSDRFSKEDKKLLWRLWQKNLALQFEVLTKRPNFLLSSELQDLNSNKAVLTLDNLNQISVLYKYENSVYFSYGKIKAFDKYPLTLMLFIISMGALLITIGLGLILKKINKDLGLIYLSASRIFRGEENVETSIGNIKILDSINKIFADGSARLERARREQQELVAAVSHELRTPLARLLFSIQMIEDTQNIKEVRKHAASMEDDVEELNTMVDEILTYNRLDKAEIKLNLVLVNLEEISKNVINNLYAMPKHSQVELQVSGDEKPYEILADERYIQRAIHNLVTNANRYAKSKIIIRNEYYADFVNIVVEDDGMGIPKEDRKTVFSPFVRLDNSRNRSSGGYGLGLSIVSKVVSWHKASIEVQESESLGGAKFCIKIVPDKLCLSDA